MHIRILTYVLFSTLIICNTEKYHAVDNIYLQAITFSECLRFIDILTPWMSHIEQDLLTLYNFWQSCFGYKLKTIKQKKNQLCCQMH